MRIAYSKIMLTILGTCFILGSTAVDFSSAATTTKPAVIKAKSTPKPTTKPLAKTTEKPSAAKKPTPTKKITITKKAMPTKKATLTKEALQKN